MTTLIERALQSRRVIFQGAIVATVIALGVNLLAAWLTRHFESNESLVLMVGALCVVIGYLYFIRHPMSERHKNLDIDGVILLDPAGKGIVPASEYEFSEKLEKTLRAAFVENEALMPGASWICLPGLWIQF
jgi:hypothetical protein